jgi:alkylation response protein AidB-like acyl-CoA dehydrogenase
MDRVMDQDMARMLGDAAQRWAAERYTLPQRKPLLERPGAFDAEVWRALAAMGWLALRVPEAHGGLDADPLAVSALMEVVGTHLLLEPVLASAVVATSLLMRLASPAQREVLAPRLIDGGLKLAFTGVPSSCTWRDGALHGTAIAVLHGDVADSLLVAAHDERQGRTVVLLVDAPQPGLQCQRYRLVDGRGAANISFRGADGQALAAGHEADAAIDTALDEARVALCAESVGIMRALVAATCSHLKLRQQFGRAIGSNQVLQHRMVEMFVLQEEAAALTARAQQALPGPARERALAVSGARAYLCRAARQVANDAVQLHGGLGITDELAVSHHFRRLMVNAALFGHRDAQFERYLALAEPSARRDP